MARTAHLKDDVTDLVQHLADHIQNKCQHRDDGKEGVIYRLKPNLCLVENHNEGELSST